ncbi:MAG: hypothetical protein LBV12_10550 [Puniceicoccales bacterium]|jgi:membrane-bound serine protease (ClpP class)|nr:hypothetical protein [Puniceicoccales bacterium]
MPSFPALLLLLLAILAPSALFGTDTTPEPVQETPPAASTPEAKKADSTAPKSVYVVRVDGPIGQPTLFMARRALKEAISNKADVFLLDLNTPGGELGAMIEIMEGLSSFPGHTVTYINTEAISAGSYIANATDEIWFAPKGIMGAADVVKGDGSDVGETMKKKLHSYIDAKVRSLAQQKGDYRKMVQRAMMDADYELKIGDVVIKPKGELLSLTAEEAIKAYGEPPIPILAAGIANDLNSLVSKIAGEKYEVTYFEKNWAEYLALLIQWGTPILLAIAGLCIFIEYKTPGFGAFGITAGILFFIVFAGNYVAGLAGYEPLVLLVIGVILIVVEVIFFPGTYITLTLGIVSLLGGLVWSMLDVWPQHDFSFTPEMFVTPLANLGSGLVMFGIAVAVLWRYLPKSVLHNRIILEAEVAPGEISPSLGADILPSEQSSIDLPSAGDTGTAITDLRLAGVVEINGKRYNAISPTGMVDRGQNVIVREVRGDALEVEAT